MANENKTMLAPVLRFPEFRTSEAWEERILGEEGEFLSSLTGKAAVHFGVGQAKYVTYMNVYANTFTDISSLGTVDVGDDESQNTVEVGDVLFTISSETPDEVGMSSVVLETVPHCYLNSFCALFRFADEKRPNLGFLGYALRQPMVREFFAARAQGSTRFNLSKVAFRSAPVAIPSRGEQQKIADCLMSLDAVISAQGRKVEALKRYKRGLIQQLFPHEGESKPRLRFAEFRDAPGWRSEKAGTLFTNRSERGMHTLPVFSVTMTDGLVSRASLNRHVDDLADATANKRAYEHDIVYNTMRMWQGACGVADADCMLSPAYVVLAPKSEVHSPFFGYVFKQPHMLRLFTAHSRGLTEDRLRLYFDDFCDVPVQLPSLSEQRRIADCLTAFDRTIDSETTRLDELNAHKRALMHQLFPSAEAV